MIIEIVQEIEKKIASWSHAEVAPHTQEYLRRKLKEIKNAQPIPPPPPMPDSEAIQKLKKFLDAEKELSAGLQASLDKEVKVSGTAASDAIACRDLLKRAASLLSGFKADYETEENPFPGVDDWLKEWNGMLDAARCDEGTAADS